MMSGVLESGLLTDNYAGPGGATGPLLFVLAKKNVTATTTPAELTTFKTYAESIKVIAALPYDAHVKTTKYSGKTILEVLECTLTASNREQFAPYYLAVEFGLRHFDVVFLNI